MAHTKLTTKTITLAASTVSTVTLDAGPDIVTAPVGTSNDGITRTPKLMGIEILNVDGAEAIYALLTKGDDAGIFAAPANPTVKGDGELVVAKAAGDTTRIPCNARQVIVKLISPGTPTVTVRSDAGQSYL